MDADIICENVRIQEKKERLTEQPRPFDGHLRLLHNLGNSAYGCGFGVLGLACCKFFLQVFGKLVANFL